MKNKVLRLAIVAVLVVAMVLSMAACTKPVDPTPSPVVTPTPTKTPDKTPDKTPTPTKTPEVSTDEAKLQELYGITFPVAEGMKVEFDTAATLKVIDADKAAVTFGAKAPDYNNAYNAYKKAISVTAKVTGLTAEGAKIDLGENLTQNDGTPDVWATFAPKAAGTYTIVYTVKVAYDGEAVYGGYKPAKVSETYSVTKVYEVAKKAITIESMSDAHKKEASLAYPAAVMQVGGKSINDAKSVAILKELKLAGEDAKYDLSIDIVSADLTAYGTYPLTLVCLDTKGQKIDLTTLVAPNFEVTFKTGNRYVLTDTELAAAAAAQDDVAAAAAGAKKEDIALGVSTYTALSDASKTWFLQANKAASEKDDANATLVTTMTTNNKNLEKEGLVAEAKALAKTWQDKLQNAEDGKKFVTYMLGLGDDTEFVTGKLTAAHEVNALKLVAQYKVNALDNFTKQFNAVILSIANFNGAFNNTAVESLAKAVAKLQAAYDALVAGQSATTVTQVNTNGKTNNKDNVGEGITDIDPVANLVLATDTMANLMARSTKASEEMTARYAAYATLVDGLDAYTGAKVTKDMMTLVLGYNFGDKKVNNAKPDAKSASQIIFNVKKDALSSTNGYVVFSTPMLFVENAAKAYKVVVDAYVALDAAIVSAQKDVVSTLGSKITYAVDPKVLVDEFNGTTFVNSTGNKDTDVTRLVALQNYIAEKALAAVVNEENVPFAELAKKELSVIIAAALKEPVSVVNEYIKGDDAFKFTLNAVAPAATEITFNDLFAVGFVAADVTVNVYKANALTVAVPVTFTTYGLNTFTTIDGATLAAGDIIRVTHNGITAEIKVA